MGHQRRYPAQAACGAPGRSPKPMVRHTCPRPACRGKQTYATKGDARRAARQYHPGDRLSPYRCVDGWHLGHLPPAVVAGNLPRTAHST